MATPEVISKTRHCQQIISKLQECDMIAVDAEGINLSKKGPLTLLQIATLDGQVYLFDIYTNHDLLAKGPLRQILQSEDIIKVMHSSQFVSSALYFQFDICLQNVFDTQIAHLVIENHKGRKLPKCLKLSDICSMYSEMADVSEEKGAIKEIYCKEIGNYWGIRPLTDEMIACASGDVTALIPEVYEKQNEYLTRFDLHLEFKERVVEEVYYNIDKKMSKKRFRREHEIMREILANFPNKYGSDMNFCEITDADDITALKKIKYTAPNLHPLVARLKTEAIKTQLGELESQLSDDEDDFMPTSRSYSFLKAYQYHPDNDIKRKSKRIWNSINTTILDDIILKYDAETTIDMLSFIIEKEALDTLRPRSVHDKKIDRLLLKLYWQLKEDTLDRTTELFQKHKKAYSIPENFYKWIKFCCHGRVPESMSVKATRLLEDLEATFGKGVVPDGQDFSD